MAKKTISETELCKENILDSLATLEKKINTIYRLASQCVYILDQHKEKGLIPFDAHCWLANNMNIIQDTHCFDDIADISNALEQLPA